MISTALGGENANDAFISSVEVLDKQTSTWQVLPQSLPVKEGNFAAVAVDSLMN